MRKALVFTAVAAFGCSAGPTHPSVETGAGALTVTDSTAYTIPQVAGEPIRIQLLFSNRTSDTVWLIRCGGPWPELEKLVGGEWVRASNGLQLLCLTATPVETGTQRRTDYRLYPERLAVDALPGIYRVVWEEAVWNFERRTATSLFGDLLPLENRVSNQFRLDHASTPGM